ncbi:hypothetical protein ON010_g15747 [Phytophthora cinnamomi]|nr:hypothetical protein ON010_g15747 [Phytophthora cinnamomi]
MFNVFPPWGNGIIGPEGRKSIIPEITSDDLPISIHFNWKGPHEDFPVCSMVGVSIAGYAEINIYLEAQDDSEMDMLLQIAGTALADFLVQSASERANVSALKASTRTPDAPLACLAFLERNARGVQIVIFLTGTGSAIAIEVGTRSPTVTIARRVFSVKIANSVRMTAVMAHARVGVMALVNVFARRDGNLKESSRVPRVPKDISDRLVNCAPGIWRARLLAVATANASCLARKPCVTAMLATVVMAASRMIFRLRWLLSWAPLHYQRWASACSEYVEISDMADLEYFVSNDSRDWLIPFDSLSLQCEVGNGTSGQVFRSLLHSGGGSSVVAVKRLYSPVTGQEYFQSFFRREVSILSRLHHPNVVRFYGVSYYNRVLYIVTDFCPKSLSGLIENPAAKGPLEEAVFMKVINQIVSGMGFLHSRNVVHRDLKPANVLISETDDVNICDFGLSRLIEPDATTMTAEVGTPSYMAPEMATMGGIQCSTKGDVYSFGILLYSTWSRSKPYGDQGMNPFQLMTAVVNGLRPVIPINCPPALARLMRSCWHQNPDIRPSFPEISQILKDQWLLSMFAEGEEEDYYYPESPGRVPSSQLMSASSSLSTIPAAAAGHRRGSKDSVNAMSPFASPRHGGGDGYGTYKEDEAADEDDAGEEDRLLNEEKRPR